RARQHQERVAVGLAARDRFGGERAGKTGLGLDYDRLAETLLELVGEDARDDVDVAARREALHHPDQAVGIILRRRRRDKSEPQEKRRRELSDHAKTSCKRPPFAPPLRGL